MSDPSKKKDAKEIFQAAVEYYLPHQWEAYIHDVCGEDEVLREKVRGLLEAHRKTDSFFDNKRDGRGDPPHISERPGSQIGPYKLLQSIGEGGFGVVYMAEQQRPVRRKVALKIIKPGMDTKQVIARFEAERQALAIMDHPNIAKVLDAGSTESGRPYFVMELVKGVPITEFCDTNKLSNQQRLELFATVCRAIQHAHQKGVIHRDLKPSNVMVTLHDYKPMPVVIDFGVSKAISTQLTEKTLFTAYGQMVGTPSYMSPEQAHMSRMDIDTRSDIYSLGVMLYELLTGGTPLSADELRGTAYAELQRRIREEEAPKPSTRLSTLGKAALKIAQDRNTDPKRLGQFLKGDLDWIVLKALDKDRSRRYETANGLANDIERFLKDEAVEACPPSVTYQIRKFVGRNRGLVTTASLVLSSILVGMVGTTAGMIRARQEAGVAQVALAEASESRDIARSLAAEKQQEAENARQAQREAKSQSVKQLTMRAAAERQRGDITLAALLGAEALKQDVGNESQKLNHRRRLTADLRQCPRPTLMLSYDTAVSDARFSRDGKWITTCCDDGTVRIHDAKTGKLEQTLQHDGTVNAVTFMLDDTRLLTHGFVQRDAAEGFERPGRIHLWDWRAGESLAKHAIVPYREMIDEDYQFRSSYMLVLSRKERELISAVDGQPLGPKLQTEGRIKSGTRGIDDRSVLVQLFEDRNEASEFGRPLPEFLRRGTTHHQIWFADSGEIVPLVGQSDSVPNTRFMGSKSGETAPFAVTPASIEPQKHRIAFVDNRFVNLYDAQTGQQLWRTRFEETKDLTGIFGGRFASGSKRVIGVERFSPDGGMLLCRNPDGLTLVDVATGNVQSTIRVSSSDTDSASFSPDGKRLLAINRQGAPQIWDVETGRVESPPIALGTKIQDFGFSPDGRFVKVVSGIGKLQVWDTQTEGPATPLLRLGATITKTAFSRDGSHLMVAAGNQVYLWPIGWPEFRQVTIDRPSFEGQGITALIASRANSAHITPDGNRVISFSLRVDDQDSRQVTEARVYDASTDQPLAEPVEIDGVVLGGVQFSLDGRSALLSNRELFPFAFERGQDPPRARSNSALRTTFWNLETGRLIELASDGGRLIESGLSSDGALAWTTTIRGFNRTDVVSRIWDTETGEPLGPPIEHRIASAPARGPGARFGFGRPAPNRGVSAIGMEGQLPYSQRSFADRMIFCSDGERLIAVEQKKDAADAQASEESSAYQMRVIDTRTGKQVFEPLEYPEGRPTKIFVSEDERRLIAVSRFGGDSIAQSTYAVRVWDIENQGELLHQHSWIAPSRSNIKVDSTGTRFLFVASNDNVVRMCDFASERTRPLLHEVGVISVAFSPDGQSILTACVDGILRIWDFQTGELIRVLEEDSEVSPRSSATFSDDGSRVIATHPTTGPQIWDIASGQRLTAKPASTYAPAREFLRPMGQKVSQSADRMIVDQADKFVIYDLSPDTRPLEELIQMTQLLSGREVNEFGNIQSIPAERWDQMWQSSREDLYENLVEPPRNETWHRRLAESTEDIHQRLWHLDRLIENGVKEAKLFEQRGNLLAHLGRYEQAISDYQTSEELGAESNIALGHCLLLKRKWDEAAEAYARSGSDLSNDKLESRSFPRSSQTRDRFRTGASNRFRQGLSYLLAGDEEAYEQVCQSLVDLQLGRLGGAPLERQIRLALLIPREIEYCDKLQEKLDEYTSRTTSPSDDNWTFRVEQFLAFRRGNYRAALEMSVESEPGSDNWAMSRLIEAMSLKNLGEEERAREVLEQVTPPVAEPSLDLNVASRAIAETSAQIVGLFYDEAVELIGHRGN